MTNPFSANGASRFAIKHYAGVGAGCNIADLSAYTPCDALDDDAGDCDSELVDFTAPSSAELHTYGLEDATIELAALDGGTNYLGDDDATMKFTFLPTRYFPKYGGNLLIIVPKRYGPGTEGIFRKSNDRTTCTSPVLLNMRPPFYEEKDDEGLITITYSV